LGCIPEKTVKAMKFGRGIGNTIQDLFPSQVAEKMGKHLVRKQQEKDTAKEYSTIKN
jgi:hypothetical protein